MDEQINTQNLSSQQTKKNSSLIGVILLLFILIAFGSYVLGTKSVKSISVVQPATQTLTLTPIPSPASIQNTNSYTENTNVPNQKKFVSPRLGISFLYMEKLTDTNGNVVDNVIFQTKEIGNRVYLYANDMTPEKGQWVEVFSKDPQKTLEETIKQDFLSGYSERDCLLSSSQKNSNIDIYSSNFELLRMTLRPGTSDDAHPMGNVNLCPSQYVSFGGDNFFLMDKNHPEKYLFFSIGQYPIMAVQGELNPSTPDTTWQETITLL